jgi:hypothetical protein
VVGDRHPRSPPADSIPRASDSITIITVSPTTNVRASILLATPPLDVRPPETLAFCRAGCRVVDI